MNPRRYLLLVSCAIFTINVHEIKTQSSNPPNDIINDAYKNGTYKNELNESSGLSTNHIDETDVKKESDNNTKNDSLNNEISDTETLIKSSLSKNGKGIKAIGVCNEDFRIYFGPYIWIYVTLSENIIKIEPENGVRTSINLNNLNNKCNDKKNDTFKFTAKIEEDILKIKWKTYTNETDQEPKSDIKKFRLPDLAKDLTSIQIFTTNTKENIIESKTYDIDKNIPEKCSAISASCFLGGSLNIESCYHCTLLAQKYPNDDECFNYISSELKNKINNDTIIKGEDDLDENSDEKILREHIYKILKKMYNNDSDYCGNNRCNKKMIKNIKELDTDLQIYIKNYCDILKKVDKSGTLDSHEIANEVEAFNNLVRLLNSHTSENIYILFEKLKSPAICVKNINEWIVRKRGLVISNEYDINSYDTTEEPNIKNILSDAFNEEDTEAIGNDIQNNEIDDENEIINLKSSSNKKLTSAYFNSSRYCNKDYCDRWQDKTSCISNIEVEEQGECGICWIFASKLHLETIRCMRGYGHYRSSALYVANCSDRKKSEICDIGSNPIEFIQILHDVKYLPLESDYPYSYYNVGDSCPTPKSNWTNLWGNNKLLYFKSGSVEFMSSYGFIAITSSNHLDDFDTYVQIIKNEIRNKGSVIAYIKTNNVIDYDFNGKIIHNLCGDDNDDADHAATIIGYGNYISNTGEKRSYWLIRNSWGYYWGDEGNFKVDIYGPQYCKYNFIQTVVFFKLDLGVIEGPQNNNQVYNYFSRHIPAFFTNLFYSSYDKRWDELSSDEELNNYNKNISISGQTDNQINTNNDFYNEDTDYINEISTSSSKNISIQKKLDITHVLKYVKNNKTQTSFIKYDDILEIEHEHNCSRVQSIGLKNKNECKSFCLENWVKCKNHPSPGYCLTTLYSGEDCFFCNI
ncbi:serine repeat antigen 4 [Plasmodium yoelii]|uniref:Serine repeat antigen 4 n=3 Tax=Plasmodium yoelii TaxID=5861 RepID=A0AAE9WLX8_PLAYO|nr:serine repeat antigen 4 [Plasmodium yoelii]WBY54965.1 serine repeat antigen 4 [Plasmodium yoelii yoelii]CDU16241.1 serine repeat antigen 4 [Plasmodium yoelii]VTZ72440.1 serine repeat antigen 4 [Plasmodium yoelii]|eukprot:XP_730866.2 serine repeat antigen 4 [Plasmodium yoelii]